MSVPPGSSSRSAAAPRGRIADLGSGVFVLMVTFVVVWGITTVQSLSRGALELRAASVASGAASVGACTRVGPVSWYGFGYWWDCHVQVSLPEGRQVDARVGPSVVTPADRGHPVEVVEVCAASGHRDCAYKRKGSVLVELGVRALGIVFWISLVIGLLLGGIRILRALLGDQRARRYLQKRGRGDAEPGAPPRDPAPEPSPPPPGSGLVRVALRQPASAIGALYQEHAPVLAVDGAERETIGWGTHRLVLSPGQHRLSVRVPFGSDLTVGQSSVTVSVVEGTETVVVYDAPEVIGRDGSLRVAADPVESEFRLSRLRLLVALCVLYAAAYAVFRVVSWLAR